MPRFKTMLLRTLLSILLFLSSFSPSLSFDRYFNLHAKTNSATISLEVTHPVPQEQRTPSCSLSLLRHDFANTYGLPPFVANYSPPSNCSAPWSAVVLELSASSLGEQYDRIVAVWLDGVEILRTSTAEPTPLGVSWILRKDVSRYASALSRSNSTLYVMLANIVNDVYTGIYHLNLTLHYYQSNATASPNSKIAPDLGRKDDSFKLHGRKLGAGISNPIEPSLFRRENNRTCGGGNEKCGELLLRLPSQGVGVAERRERLSLYSEKPADLIIPVSDNGENGFWFRIQNESDVHSKGIKIPSIAYKAVLEIYVSYHGNDEFWYSNLPNDYIKKKNLTTSRGNGAFRQVFAQVDEYLVGSFVPFPVVFTGGINPLFWVPVVAIGAFDLPSYDLDITPFLGHLLDGRPHSFRLGVTDALSFWLVDANLHLWLDHLSPQVNARLVKYKVPTLQISRDTKFKSHGGKFKIKGGRGLHFMGWVSSSLGNLTTNVDYELKFKNKIILGRDGNFKQVYQKINAGTEIDLRAQSVLMLAKHSYKNFYPLRLQTTTEPKENNTYLSTTSFSHEMNERSSIVLPSGIHLTSLINTQSSQGLMLVQDHSVLSGAATTSQNYTYKDENGCFSRIVLAREGQLLEDNSSNACLQDS